MIRDSENINHLWTNLVIEECVRNDVDFFCISPGSRSTPLTVAAARNPKAQTTICIDERGAAYYALGYAKATQKPAVLICTSGTAVANYLPAVVEASNDHVPLILLTADRPPELLETGANQTINQHHIFGKFVRWEFNLGPPNTETPVAYVLTSVDQAIHRAKTNPAGPVHLNFMFREPLAPTKVLIPKEYINPIKTWEKNSTPYTSYNQPKLVADFGPVAKLLSSAKNGLLVVGRLYNSKEIKAVAECAEKIDWPLFADISSGLRTGLSLDSRIAYFDLLLLSKDYETNYKPDLILHVGGRVTSKRYLQFVESNPQITYVHIDNSPERLGPSHTTDYKIQSDILNALFSINKLKLKKAKSLPHLLNYNSKTEQLLKAVLSKNNRLAEPAVARLLSQIIPKGTGLFLSNSMPIRDMDMFADPHGPTVSVGTNRGASGIDGIFASATGFANGLRETVTCLIGDLAFFHDLNSLYLVKNSLFPVIIVVINNFGGGIFSFLPISNFPELTPHFETPHTLNFEHAAKLFGLPYYCPGSLSEFENVYSVAVKSPQSTIINVSTEIQSNKKTHLQLYDAVKKLLKEGLGGQLEL
jgi:2-succinyl-5-enolpyruvyl-6-hydroxy-3-cyclohexene-1-carboxylate synthase